MSWCSSCGERYRGPAHNCGYVTITKDRLRELEDQHKRRKEVSTTIPNAYCVILGEPGHPSAIVGPFATEHEAAAHRAEHEARSPSVLATVDVLLNPARRPNLTGHGFVLTRELPVRR